MNLFRQQGSHADRVAASVRSGMRGTSSAHVYVAACVELDGDFISYITDDCREVELTADEFWDLLGDEVLAMINRAFGYVDMEGDIRDDRHVAYRKSWAPPDHPDFPSREVIFFDHSRIEYVWIRSRRT